MAEAKVKGDFWVYSTLATDTRYALYGAAGNIEKDVLIKGGAGVANDRLVTLKGIATRISAEEKELLEANGVFKIHADNGFVKIESVKEDAEVVAADMTAKDKSAPLTPDDFVDVENKPVVNKKGK